MTIDFAQVVSSPPSGRTTALIIDHAAYAQQVLLRGAPMPWLDETAYVSLLAQAEGLLKPDVTLLDTGPVLDALLAQDSSLVAAMGARTRVGYALKTLLAHEGTAERLMRVVSVVSRMSRLPLVLQVPGPVTLAARAHVLAGAGEASDVTADHAENLSVYLADWLRRFSSVPVSLLLLDGRRAGSQELDAEDLTACTPVLNAAEHYRWTVGLRTDDGVLLSGGDLKGASIPAEYWLGEDVALAAGDFRITELPGGAEPETVLARLSALAGKG